MSRAADGTSTLHDIDFSSLSFQLGHLAAVSTHVYVCVKLPHFAVISIYKLMRHAFPSRFFFLLTWLLLLHGPQRCPSNFWIR